MSNIERTEAVWKPVAGCTPDLLTQPLRWRKPRMVAVNSTSDLFDEAVPTEFVDRVFAVMAICPQHTFQVLTKRPDRMADYLRGILVDDGVLQCCDGAYRLSAAAGDMIYLCAGKAQQRLHDFISDTFGSDDEFLPGQVTRQAKEIAWPLPNVWLGASVETQEQADARIPHLLECPAAIRFLSCDPLLGPIYLSLLVSEMSGAALNAGAQYESAPIHWVVVAGESGPRAWPCNVEWIKGIVSQCEAARVPCYVRQLGSRPWSDQPSSHHEDATDTGHRGGILEMRHSRGADPSEWPADLRVREWPRSTP
jgi:protein gp37